MHWFSSEAYPLFSIEAVSEFLANEKSLKRVHSKFEEEEEERLADGYCEYDRLLKERSLAKSE